MRYYGRRCTYIAVNLFCILFRQMAAQIYQKSMLHLSRFVCCESATWAFSRDFVFFSTLCYKKCDVDRIKWHVLWLIVLLLPSVQRVLQRLGHISRSNNVSSRSRFGWQGQRVGRLELERLVPIHSCVSSACSWTVSSARHDRAGVILSRLHVDTEHGGNTGQYLGW